MRSLFFVWFSCGYSPVYWAAQCCTSNPRTSGSVCQPGCMGRGSARSSSSPPCSTLWPGRRATYGIHTHTHPHIHPYLLNVYVQVQCGIIGWTIFESYSLKTQSIHLDVICYYVTLSLACIHGDSETDAHVSQSSCGCLFSPYRSIEHCFHMCDRMVIYFFIAASYAPWWA